MGCDIHMYIEYRPRGTEPWWNLGGHFGPNRRYSLFERLAGVRGDRPPKYPQRGMPEDAASTTEWDNEVDLQNREQSHWLKALFSKQPEPGQRRPNRDWHSHSWLTLAEFEEVANAIVDDPEAPEVEYRAMRAAMRQLQADGCEVRVVFWFDN